MSHKKPRRGVDWDVFQTTGNCDGAWQIQRCDACDDGSSPAFKRDVEAINYVIRSAKRGDKDCIDALWEVLGHDQLVDRILWCQAMGWNEVGDADYPS